MKVAVYAGTFNPWHLGHQDILKKALKIFDKIIIAVGGNQNKDNVIKENYFPDNLEGLTIEIHYFSGLLTDFIKELGKNYNICAVIRGLRNGSDLQYEQNMLYWNEDLGLSIPIIYFICDRTLSHYSSSMVREINHYQKYIFKKG